MSGVTKLSVSLPTPLAAALKQEAAERGIPLSQLLTETLERQAKVAGFRQMIEETFGPFTEEDLEAGRALLASARTPDEILGDA